MVAFLLIKKSVIESKQARSYDLRSILAPQSWYAQSRFAQWM